MKCANPGMDGRSVVSRATHALPVGFSSTWEATIIRWLLSSGSLLITTEFTESRCTLTAWTWPELPMDWKVTSNGLAGPLRGILWPSDCGFSYLQYTTTKSGQGKVGVEKCNISKREKMEIRGEGREGGECNSAYPKA